MGAPSVLVLHNRYRAAGGEERAVELHGRALERGGIRHRMLIRESGSAGRAHAGAALLRGGDDPDEVAAAVGELGAGIVHCHNMQPLLGPRALAAARDAGARVVLHLHNFRLFCAIGVAYRDGAPCFRCRRRRTLPGLVLNCRGSVPEAVAYAVALAAHQPAVLDAVSRFATPSEFAADRLARLGLPRERVVVVRPYLPAEDLVESSNAAEGEYALVAARLAPEKGIGVAVEAAALSGVPLRVAGEGELSGSLREQARQLGAPVEFLGQVGPEELRQLRRGAAMAIVPSTGNEVAPFAALEAAAAGLPVVAARGGSLPELVGESRCVPRGDPAALAAAMRSLMDDPAGRAADGEELLASVREHHSERGFLDALLDLYARA